MAIKESSDELNPTVVTQGIQIARPSGKRSAADYLALALATCGVGYLPLAPGTWGSLVGGVIFLLWQGWQTESFVSADILAIPLRVRPMLTTLTLVLILGLTLAGVWAATRVEKVLGRKDPSIVVIDEVAGQMIAFLPIHYMAAPSDWTFMLAGFLLFRAFDIWKPYPIRRLEILESGLGIMADDVLAGAYAAIVLSLLISGYLWLQF